MKWNIEHGNWWMVQWSFDSWISFGIHMDFKTRINSTENVLYGPYIDIHLLWFIFSFGRNPQYSNPYSANIIGRGGKVIDGRTR